MESLWKLRELITMIIEIDRQSSEKFVDHRNQSIMQISMMNLINKLFMTDKSKNKEKSIGTIPKNLLSIISKSLENILIQEFCKGSIYKRLNGRK